MKTTGRAIKEETIKKCLAVLKEMKYRADNNLPMHIKEIPKKYHTGHTIPHAAKLLNYFGMIGPNIWICKKERFDPIDARNVLNFAYDYRKKQPKGKSNIKNQPKDLFPLADVCYEKKEFIPPHIKQVEDYCNERGNDIDPYEWYEYYQSRNWHDSKGGKMKNWKKSVITWERNQKRPIFIKVKLSDYSNNEIFTEAKKRGYSRDKLSEYSENELIEELKNRGYSGNMKKYINFGGDEITETSEEESKVYTIGKKINKKDIPY